MDFLPLGTGDGKGTLKHVVHNGSFYKVCPGFVTPCQTAVTIAKTLYEKYLVYYGWPEKIITDQGWNLESKLITELCSLAQVKKLCTTPY